MSRGWRVWAWSMIGVLVLGIVVGRSASPSFLPLWLGFVILGLVFTVQMTRQTLREEPGLSSEERQEWDRRLVWLGPIGVIWLLIFRPTRQREQKPRRESVFNR